MPPGLLGTSWNHFSMFSKHFLTTVSGMPSYVLGIFIWIFLVQAMQLILVFARLQGLAGLCPQNPHSVGIKDQLSAASARAALLALREEHVRNVLGGASDQDKPAKQLELRRAWDMPEFMRHLFLGSATCPDLDIGNTRISPVNLQSKGK